MKKDKNKILSNAAILGVSAFISKVLGAIYRVPLTSIIGSEGLGIYQMVFPVYVFLLELSGAGIPNGLSKLISSEKNSVTKTRSYFITSIKFFSVLGAFASILLIVLAKPLSVLQGDKRATLSYVMIAPSIFLVCIISCVRGYFQGLINMVPTAISQITEQSIKLICGLTFSLVFMPDIMLASAAAVFAVTVSELVAAVYLIFYYKKHADNLLKTVPLENSCPKGVMLKKVLACVIPVSLIGIILPFSQVIDTFIIINNLSKHFDNSTSIYGLFSGVAMTIINVPVSVCYGIAATAIPSVSSADTVEKENKNAIKCILLTLLISVPIAFFCFSFSPFIIGILFPRLNVAEKSLSTGLVKSLSCVIVFASLLQTINGILIAKGKTKKGILGLIAGVSLKVLLNLFLTNKKKINIYGAVIGLNACYLVANLINLIMLTIKRTNKNYENKAVSLRRNDCKQ